MENGQMILEHARLHLGEPYILGALVPKKDAHWRGPWDCAELVVWAVYQASAKLYGCANNAGNPVTADAYTGFLKRDSSTLGHEIPVDVAARIPGAAVLRYSGSGVTGHVVISDGRGGTVEAHSHKTGVIRNKITGRRWDIGIQVPWIDYSPEEKPVFVAAPSEVIYRWTTPLMRGPEIKKIQERLFIKADGVYGSGTFYSVKLFQFRSGLVADGEAGPKTLAALGIDITDL